MKTKQITTLAAFIVTFAISVTIANFFTIEQGAVVLRGNSRTAQQITTLLKQDIANGQDGYLNENYIISTFNYVNDSESIDDSNLPRDFQLAWRAHMRAWRKQANFLETKGSLEFSNAAFVRAYSVNRNEINRTWWEVLRIADKHGAEIPAGAY